MGDMKGLLGMLPGMGKMAKQIKDAEVNPKAIKRQEGILLSMTPGERRQPALIKASRKKRIAAGSGMSVQDVNRLLKQHQQMGTVMKQMKKKGLAGMFSGGMPGAGLGGGLPGGMPQGIPFRGR
jgi:signal recognition particle subunit SRP54